MSHICAQIIIGSRYEPHFAECLRSLFSVVDSAVVDVNGDNPQNMAALEASELFKAGRLKYEFRPWQGFAEARNHTLEMLPDQAEWILRADADEVHFPQWLQIVNRQLLPALKPSINIVDCYWLCFCPSYQYVWPLERRHDFLIRRTPGMHWDRSVHEQLCGLTKQRVAVPYVFHHYASITDPELIIAKRKLYDELSGEELAHNLKLENYLSEQEHLALRYLGDYPPIALADLQAPEKAPAFIANFNQRMAKLNPAKLPKWRSLARIYFRLAPLLGNLETQQSRRQAIHLAAQLLRVFR